jgi:hypothetical protein
MTSWQLFIYRYSLVYVWDRTSGSHDKRGPVSIASNFATFSWPDWTWLGTRNMRLNFVHRHFLLSDNPLVFEIFPYPSPASLKPEARKSQFPSFIPPIWHLSVPGPNPILQPREPLCLGCNIGSFLNPYFQRGEATVMTSRQVFIYRCNPVYVWDRT